MGSGAPPRITGIESPFPESVWATGMGQVNMLARSLSGSSSDPAADPTLQPCTDWSGAPAIGGEPKPRMWKDGCSVGTER